MLIDALFLIVNLIIKWIQTTLIEKITSKLVKEYKRMVTTVEGGMVLIIIMSSFTNYRLDIGRLRTPDSKR